MHLFHGGASSSIELTWDIHHSIVNPGKGGQPGLWAYLFIPVQLHNAFASPASWALHRSQIARPCFGRFTSHLNKKLKKAGFSGVFGGWNEHFSAK
jgi:hypothetical protein